MEIIAADSSKPNIRRMALNALLMINEEGRHSNTVIDEALKKYTRLDPRDKALFVKIVHGTLEYQIRIDSVIDRISSVKAGKMKPFIRNLLRMSVYQILLTDKIPDSAVCDEAVKIIKRTSYRNLSGFVNGVLRNAARGKDGFDFTGDVLKYSVPEWMINLLRETIGTVKTEEFLEYSLKSHGVSIRKTGSDEVYVAESADGLFESEDWKSGRITVQDYSATLPVIMADIMPGNIVIDVCASPGGKTIQASEKSGKNGKIISCDISEKKTERIKANITRMGGDNIEVAVRDATVKYPEYAGMADVVIADCPCSGIGTISKKPEIKNRLTPDDCRSLADIQLRILLNVSDYVKKGGKLVYSTCTLDHLENEDNIRKFLENKEEFSLIEEKVMIPSENEPLPFDGFYIAVMTKNA